MAYDVGDYLIQARMSAVTGLPADLVMNDFAVSYISGTPDTAAITSAMAAVGDFYRDGTTTADCVGKYISPYVNRAATHELAAYKITAGPLGSPVLTLPWLGPVTPATTDSMPEEVAAVLSLHAELTGVLEESGATRPRARRRARIYVGPLTQFATDYDVFPVRLRAAFTGALRTRAVALADDLEAAGWYLSVWSRADATLRPVVGGWTDNAPDTQRRRGPDATVRVTFGPVGP